MSIPQSGGGPIEHHDQLSQYLADGCKPMGDWRIGTEHEKFGYDTVTLMPLPYNGTCGIRTLLDGLREEFGWDPVQEDENKPWVRSQEQKEIKAFAARCVSSSPAGPQDKNTMNH